MIDCAACSHLDSCNYDRDMVDRQLSGSVQSDMEGQRSKNKGTAYKYEGFPPPGAHGDAERMSSSKSVSNVNNTANSSAKPMASSLKKTAGAGKMDTSRSGTARSDTIDEDDFWDETTRYAGPLTDDETGR